MITCAVCSHQNDDLDTTCASCGSFIQDRVPNLDFFSTIWRIIESPRDAFRRIVLAEHKNYVLFLMMFLGIAVSFGLLWIRHVGNEFENLLHLLVLGGFMGFTAGIPLGLAMMYTAFWALKLVGGKGTLRNTYGVFGWSLAPIMLSVIFVLPIELASMGLFLFSSNPSAFELKPVVFIALVGLDALAVLWSFLLAARGLSIVHRLSAFKTLLVVSVVEAGYVLGIFSLFSRFVV